MQSALTSRSPDLLRLRDDGYEVEPGASPDYAAILARVAPL